MKLNDINYDVIDIHYDIIVAQKEKAFYKAYEKYEKGPKNIKFENYYEMKKSYCYKYERKNYGNINFCNNAYYKSHIPVITRHEAYCIYYNKYFKYKPIMTDENKNKLNIYLRKLNNTEKKYKIKYDKIKLKYDNNDTYENFCKYQKIKDNYEKITNCIKMINEIFKLIN